MRRKEYDYADSLIYAWEREDMYGCHNDIICLLYDRLIKHCITPRRPSYLVVGEEYPVSYGFSYAKSKVYLDKNTYVLELYSAQDKLTRFAQKVCEALKISYNINKTKNGDVIKITAPISICNMDICDYLKKYDLPLEFANRLGFKQYPNDEVVSIEEEDDEEEDFEDDNDLERYDLLCLTNI